MTVVVKLLDPIRRGSTPIAKIALRNPGRATLESMAATRRDDGWPEPMVIRFVSHLSSLVETTVAICSERDLVALKAALDKLFHEGQRRLGARLALTGAAKEAREVDHG